MRCKSTKAPSTAQNSSKLRISTDYSKQIKTKYDILCFVRGLTFNVGGGVNGINLFWGATGGTPLRDGIM